MSSLFFSTILIRNIKMKKYTLTVGGLELLASGHSLKNNEVKALQDFQKEKKINDLYEIGIGISDIIKGYDPTKANMWETHKVSKNDSLVFSLTDGKKWNLSFTLLDIKSQPKKNITILNSTPVKGKEENILLWINEGKGNVCTFTFESVVEPKLSDFTFGEGKIVAPDGNWEFIDTLYFKGVELKPDYSSNDVKNEFLTVELWSL